MGDRPNPVKLTPDAYKAMKMLSDYTQNSGLDKKLLELVKIRASQINGCAFCLDMHATAAMKLGETDLRMLMLSAWDEAGLYSEREKAALAWTEAVTLISESQISDELYKTAREHFSEKELADLTWAITVINGWNRMMVAFAVPPSGVGGKTSAQ